MADIAVCRLRLHLWASVRRLDGVATGVQRKDLRDQRGRRHLRPAGGPVLQAARQEHARRHGPGHAGNRPRKPLHPDEHLGVSHRYKRRVTEGTMRRAVASAALCAAWMVLARAAGAQTATFVPVGSIAGPVNMVEADGRYAYLAAGKALTVVDISNPASPVRAGAYTFPEMIWGVAVVGTTVYVAADTYGLG